MLQPTGIKDKSALAYIEYLKTQIEELKNHTDKKLWRGIHRQLDFLAEELLSDNFRLSLEDDKAVDRFLKILEKIEPISKGVEKFEAKIFPKEITNEKKPLSEDSAENYLKR